MRLNVYLGIILLPVYLWASTGTVTKGDNTPLLMTATTDGSTAFNLASAQLTTYFLKSDGTEITFASTSHSITNQTTGQYQLNWTAAETAQLQAGDNIKFRTKVEQASTTTSVWFDGALRVRESGISSQ